MGFVVKHSYVKGSKAAAKMAAHINYCLYRPDHEVKTEEEREQRAEMLRVLRQEVEPLEDDARTGKADPRGKEARDASVESELKGKARPYFNQDGKQITGYEMKRLFRRQKWGDVAHKLIISPGHNGVDPHRMTQHVMKELGRLKGQEYRYGYVVHENTDHTHVHVHVLGRDRYDTQVRFDKQDYLRMRVIGDRYLEREHGLQIALDRQVERAARERGYNPYFDGDRRQLYKLLLDEPSRSLEKDAEPRLLSEEERAKRSERDHREYLLIDEEWKRLLSCEVLKERQPWLGVSSVHQVGRSAEMYGYMMNAAEREYWTKVQENSIESGNEEAFEKSEAHLKQLFEDRLALGADQALKDQTGIERAWHNVEHNWTTWEEIQRTEQQIDPMSGVDKDVMEMLTNESTKDLEPAEDVQQRIDLAAVEDKIDVGDNRYVTKFDDKEFLIKVYSEQLETDIGRLPIEDYRTIWSWIATKSTHGEKAFGEPPLIEDERAERQKPELTLIHGGLDEQERPVLQLLRGGANKEFVDSLPTLEAEPATGEREVAETQIDIERTEILQLPESAVSVAREQALEDINLQECADMLSRPDTIEETASRSFEPVVQEQVKMFEDGGSVRPEQQERRREDDGRSDPFIRGT